MRKGGARGQDARHGDPGSSEGIPVVRGFPEPRSHGAAEKNGAAENRDTFAVLRCSVDLRSSV